MYIEFNLVATLIFISIPVVAVVLGVWLEPGTRKKHNRRRRRH